MRREAALRAALAAFESVKQFTHLFTDGFEGVRATRSLPTSGASERAQRAGAIRAAIEALESVKQFGILHQDRFEVRPLNPAEQALERAREANRKRMEEIVRAMKS